MEKLPWRMSDAAGYRAQAIYTMLQTLLVYLGLTDFELEYHPILRITIVDRLTNSCKQQPPLDVVHRSNPILFHFTEEPSWLSIYLPLPTLSTYTNLMSTHASGCATLHSNL